ISHPPPITGQNFPADFYLTWSAGSHKIQLPKVFGGVAIPSNLILPSNIPLVEQGKGCSPFGVSISICTTIHQFLRAPRRFWLSRCGAGVHACSGSPDPRRWLSVDVPFAAFRHSGATSPAGD